MKKKKKGCIDKIVNEMVENYPFSSLGVSLYAVMGACEYVKPDEDYLLQNPYKLIIPFVGFATDLYFKFRGGKDGNN